MTFQVVLSRMKKRDLRGPLADELAELMKIPSTQLREELREGELIVGNNFGNSEAERIEARLEALGATVTIQKVGEPSPSEPEKDMSEVLITPEEYLEAMLHAKVDLRNKKGKFPFTLPFVLSSLLFTVISGIHLSQSAGGVIG